MLLFDNFNLLMRPWWNKSRRNRIEGGAFAVVYLSLQYALFMVTTPQLPNDAQSDSSKSSALLQNNTVNSADPTSDWNAYLPIVAPMIVDAFSTVLFALLQQRISDALQQSFTQRMLSDDANIGTSGNDCKHIGLIQLFSEPELSAADIENFGKYIADAANYCSIMGVFTNIIPMVSYGRMAYLSVPEARNVLYVGGAVSFAGCLLQYYLISLLIVADRIMKAKDLEIQSRMGRNIRHNDAVVAGRYQSAEEAALLSILSEKNSAYLRFTASYSSVLIINNLMFLGLSVITLQILSQQYPKLRGTQGLITFSFAMNLLASALLRIIFALGDKYSKTIVALNKIRALDHVLKDVNNLKNDPILKMQYNDANLATKDAIKFENFLIAIPPKHEDLGYDGEEDLQDQSGKCKYIINLFRNIKTKPKISPEPKSAKEKIAEVMRSKGANFINLPTTFSLQAGSLHRINGESGIGKSRFLAALLGIWPYASGKISFACNREEIYAMPQKELFIKGSLLQNIFYPAPVPNDFMKKGRLNKPNSKKIEYDFETSALAQRLCKTMRQIGLGDEIKRLGEIKDWGGIQDLSPGMEKRLSFLRMYMKAINGQHPPKVIMIDEANSGVDGQNGFIMEGLIRKLRREFPNVCILFIKHDLDVHPELFSDEQNELVIEDPEIFKGLKDCAIINLTRITKAKLTGHNEDVEAAWHYAVDRSPGLLFRGAQSNLYTKMIDTDFNNGKERPSIEGKRLLLGKCSIM